MRVALVARVPGRAVRLALAIVAAAVAAGAAAAPTAAAPYSVWSCRDAQGAPVSTAAWIPADRDGMEIDTCRFGGSLFVALDDADTAPGAAAGYRFAVPPGVTLSRYTAWIAAGTGAETGSPVYMAGLAQGDPFTVPDVLDGCASESPVCTFGSFAQPLAEQNRVERDVLRDDLALMVACSGIFEPCTPQSEAPARAALFRIEVELDDPSAPAVDRPGGSVAVGGPISGFRTVAGDVSDRGSGIRSTELLLDGAAVDRQESACAPPYTVADPCPSSARPTFVLDTARLPEGLHTVALRAQDAAGNTSTGAPVAFTVDHPEPPPPPPPPPPPTMPARIDMPERVNLPPSDPVTGTVTAADGAPRAGVTIRFQQRPFGGDEGDWRTMRGAAVSDAAGRFRVRVPSDSAQVRAIVPDTTVAARTNFIARLRASINASPDRLDNGERVTLRGRLRGAGGADDDRTVLIQSLVRGTWRSVDSVETDNRGRIRWRYRFTNTLQTARYRFRFVVPRTKRLPWDRLESDQVSVLVRAR